ncbi:hypothetical protein FKW77_005125 [Venturia effusa]|uniref:Uncharacterized protein n=1 Tax=Venturia effusa TaxID=50376 RepID=A0A517L7B0_9PEZI|nr:hypothetical protein FKW77_005125 [Venturia effusa]
MSQYQNTVPVRGSTTTNSADRNIKPPKENARNSAFMSSKNWRVRDVGIDEGTVPVATVPAFRRTRTNSTRSSSSSPEDNSKASAKTASTDWRANAGPPQGEPVLPNVADVYRPGQIVWLPAHDEISKDSILHGHEDFGALETPSGEFVYQQAYAHPALVLREDDTDASLLVCLKITAWTDLAGQKWDSYFSGTSDRRHNYVPLFVDCSVSQPGMPTLIFENGKSMPDRGNAGKNKSHLNVERVFLVEKTELRGFCINGQKHNLYLTADSMKSIEEYRNFLGRDDFVDRCTMRKQRRDHKEWMTLPVGPKSTGLCTLMRYSMV